MYLQKDLDICIRRYRARMYLQKDLDICIRRYRARMYLQKDLYIYVGRVYIYVGRVAVLTKGQWLAMCCSVLRVFFYRYIDIFVQLHRTLLWVQGGVVV